MNEVMIQMSKALGMREIQNRVLRFIEDRSDHFTRSEIILFQDLNSIIENMCDSQLKKAEKLQKKSKGDTK